MSDNSQANRGFRRTLSNLIFLSRWLQAPLYLGLIIAQCVYVYRFMVELWHLVDHSIFGDREAFKLAAESLSAGNASPETVIMLTVLGLIDVVMIANLLIMVIIGGYETFVARLFLDGHPDQPEWLSHVNAGILKVKLATALIGISSIHLLKSFINAPDVLKNENGTQTLLWQVVIHVVFLLSAIALAFIERLTWPGGGHGPKKAEH